MFCSSYPIKMAVMKGLMVSVACGCACSAAAPLVRSLYALHVLRQRLNALNLTIEQKRRITNLVRRERLQYYMNQRELNQILTDKQKATLLQWRKERQGNKTDSTTSLN